MRKKWSTDQDHMFYILDMYTLIRCWQASSWIANRLLKILKAILEFRTVINADEKSGIDPNVNQLRSIPINVNQCQSMPDQAELIRHWSVLIGNDRQWLALGIVRGSPEKYALGHSLIRYCRCLSMLNIQFCISWENHLIHWGTTDILLECSHIDIWD